MRKIIRGPNYTKLEFDHTVMFWNRKKTRKLEDCGVWIDGKKIKDLHIIDDHQFFIRKCGKCGSSEHHQVSRKQLEREDPEGYAKHGFYSFMECDNCGCRWFDD